MTRDRCAVIVSVLLLAGCLCLSATAHAEPSLPFYRLVDTAAQRLGTADPVAASKWITGGPITDRQRADQVLHAVAADASARGIDPQYVRAVFADQIAATEGIEYTRLAQWKFDSTIAPTAAPDLADSRTQIDEYNRTLVEEIALQWDSLRGRDCGQNLSEAVAAVAKARKLDGLYRQALISATRSYCCPV